MAPAATSSTRPSWSAHSSVSVPRSALSAAAARAQYLMILGRYGVRRLFPVSLDAETAATLHDIRARKDDLQVWSSTIELPFTRTNAAFALLQDGPRYRVTENPKTASIVATAHEVVYQFTELVRRSAEELEWYEPYRHLLQSLCVEHQEAACTQGMLGTSKATLDALSLTELIAVKPDLALGLKPQSIIIRQDRQSEPISVDPVQYVSERSERVVTGLNEVYDVPIWLPHLFVESKPSEGNLEKAELQNDTAMRIGLSAVLRMAEQAKKADPGNYRGPSSVLLRVFGLVTCGKRAALRMMKFESNKQYGVVEVWGGSTIQPVELLELISMIRYLNESVPERHEMIGHWLWCLRDLEATSGTLPVEAETIANADEAQDDREGSGSAHATPQPRQGSRSQKRKGEGKGKGKGKRKATATSSKSTLNLPGAEVWSSTALRGTNDLRMWVEDWRRSTAA